MNPFDVYIAYVSWGADGKNRPVLIIAKGDEANTYIAFRITTKYVNKSVAIKKNYIKLVDFRHAGLRVLSYVDMNSAIKVHTEDILEYVGQLTARDKERIQNHVS